MRLLRMRHVLSFFDGRQATTPHAPYACLPAAAPVSCTYRFQTVARDFGADSAPKQTLLVWQTP